MALFGGLAEVLRAGKSRRNIEMFVDSKALASGVAAFVTPFRTILGVIPSLVNAATPDVGTSVLTQSVSGATVTVSAWKVTSSSVTTLIAATGTEVVHVIVFGTR